MIAKVVLLFCLVAASNSTFLKKLVHYQTPIVHYRYLPAVHEYVAQPVVHQVVHPVQVENVVQPVIHTVHKTPILRHSVETPELEPHPPVLVEGPGPLGHQVIPQKK